MACDLSGWRGHAFFFPYAHLNVQIFCDKHVFLIKKKKSV